VISIAKQRVMGRFLSPFFALAMENKHNYPMLNGLQRILGKIGGQRAFKRFSPIQPTNDVTIQLSLAKTRPNGTFRRFIRFPPRLRTTAPGLKVGN
jgi:hypothetical protein